MALPLIPILTTLISPVTDYLTRRQDRKQLQQQAEAKITQSRLDNDKAIELSIHEWEAINVTKQDSSWKDELVTLVFLLPIIMIFVGSIYGAFTGNMTLLEGTLKGIEALKELGIDFGTITTTVVFAAVGIKAVNRFK
jgi:hypothetical protein